MKIAVIGMGKVGSVLGRRWSEAGHAVVFGVRNPNDPKKQVEARAANASLASVREAELGPLWASRLLEPLAVTWIVLSRQPGFGKDFALNVVRRPGS